MPVSTAGKNFMLDALAGVAVFASLHSADPGDTGANELTGGSPAYTRKAITWFAAAAGNLDNNANPTWDVPAGATVSYVGYWSAATAGTFYGSADVTNEVYAGQGTYSLTDSDISLT